MYIINVNSLRNTRVYVLIKRQWTGTPQYWDIHWYSVRNAATYNKQDKQSSGNAFIWAYIAAFRKLLGVWRPVSSTDTPSHRHTRPMPRWVLSRLCTSSVRDHRLQNILYSPNTAPFCSSPMLIQPHSAPAPCWSSPILQQPHSATAPFEDQKISVLSAQHCDYSQRSFEFYVRVEVLRPVGIWGHLQGENIYGTGYFIYTQSHRHRWTYQGLWVPSHGPLGVVG